MSVDSVDCRNVYAVILAVGLVKNNEIKPGKFHRLSLRNNLSFNGQVFSNFIAHCADERLS